MVTFWISDQSKRSLYELATNPNDRFLNKWPVQPVTFHNVTGPNGQISDKWRL